MYWRKRGKFPYYEFTKKRNSRNTNSKGDRIQNWEIDSNPDINETFSKSSLIITSGTGSALEAVVSRKSVIIVADKTTFTTNPLSYKLGKGVVWDEVSDVEELEVAYNKLMQIRKYDYENIIDCKIFLKECKKLIVMFMLLSINLNSFLYKILFI